MDIHRCRFVPYRPQSINTLAISHRSDTHHIPPADLRLALGRENGDIEIWNPTGGTWVQEKILRGSRDRTVEQLVWTQDVIFDDEENDSTTAEDGPLRLFSSGGSPSITEWDVVTGQQKRHADSPRADIWCFAAQPQWRKTVNGSYANVRTAESAQLLVAGCSDGSLILFNTADDLLQFQRQLKAPSGKKAKVICVTWRDRKTVVAGYENGTIQVIDVPSRTVTRSMSLGKASDGSTSVVWTLKCMPDGTILSGDSSGELQIWDSKTLSLSQRLKAHDTDVLDIAISSNGNTVFTAGIDRRISIFQQSTVAAGQKKVKWQKSTHRKFHQHDVKALAAFEAKGFSVVVSGGVDTVPVVIPLRNWDSELHRTLSHLPQKPQMSCSSKTRLMLTWWDHDLFIWNLPRPSVLDANGEVYPDGVNHQLLARIQLTSEESITSAQISSDGKLLVASTMVGVKLFQIRRRIEAGDVEVRTRPLTLPQGIAAFGASMVGFSPNSRWLYAVRSSNVVAMVKILPGASSKDKPDIHDQVIKLARKSRVDDVPKSRKLEKYLQTINCLSFSSDGRVLAVGDLSGAIDTWVLEGHEDLGNSAIVKTAQSDDRPDNHSDSDSDSDDDESDSRVIQGQKWIRTPLGSSLPRLRSAILAMAFKPQSRFTSKSDSAPGLRTTQNNPNPMSHELSVASSMLVAITASSEIVEFDVMQGRLSEWSRRNPSSLLPQSFTQIKDRAMGMFWDCQNTSGQERLWLYGPTWLFMLDMSEDLRVADTQDKIGQIGKYDVREPLRGNDLLEVGPGRLSTPQISRKRKRNTGAGDEKHPQSSTLRTFTQRKGNTITMDLDLGLPSPESVHEDSEDEMEIDSFNALIQLRRGGDQPSDEQQLLMPDDAQDPPRSPDTTKSSPHYKAIWRYRSIFGIAALDTDLEVDEAEADLTITSTTNPSILLDNNSAVPRPPQTSSSSPSPPSSTTAATTTTKTTPQIKPSTDPPPKQLEIILIERPIYDVDLPPRFD